MSRNSKLPSVLIITLAAASMISLLSFGVRGAFGLFTVPLTSELGFTREHYSIAIAIQNICWGIAQPLAGLMADKRGSLRVLVIGAVLYALGVAWMTVATSPLELCASAGVLTGLGMGGASYITVLAALGRVMPESHRSWALGVGTSAGSLGQFVVVPVVQALIDAYGWRAGAWAMCFGVALIILFAFLIYGDKPAKPAAGQVSVATSKVLGSAFSHGSYVLLVLGFFVCGFQLAFITTHFPAYLADKGLGGSIASWAIAMVGLFNLVGAYMAGVWGAKWSKKKLLAGVYFGRAAVILAFILTPISNVTVLVFGGLMGLLWLSTAPLTSGLVATFFGTRHMATLFGLVFFSHQVGSFLGVYIGGYLYETTGSYQLVWWACVGLSVLAGLVNLPIREQRSEGYTRLVGA